MGKRAAKQARPIDIRTKVRGVTQGSRPAAARRCRKGERLLLVREPRNAVDPNAIAIYRRGLIFKAQLGYLSEDIARQLAPRMDAGE